MMQVGFKITPQGRILLIKAIAGCVIGLMATPLFSMLGPRLFLLATLAIYTIISYATINVAKKANPPINVYTYTFFKGFLTYYVAMFLSWTTVYIVRNY
uniref:Uncharacterized protein n=1 Tax=Fervidicoccus fontis TaxID=683846 RepID=A0A7J3ZL17_9CREN